MLCLVLVFRENRFNDVLQSTIVRNICYWEYIVSDILIDTGDLSFRISKYLPLYQRWLTDLSPKENPANAFLCCHFNNNLLICLFRFYTCLLSLTIKLMFVKLFVTLKLHILLNLICINCIPRPEIRVYIKTALPHVV